MPRRCGQEPGARGDSRPCLVGAAALKGDTRAIEDAYRNIALQDGRYSPEAFKFLFEALTQAMRLAGKEHAEGVERHVTGQEVLAGMRAHAVDLFGPLAAQVWRSWGVHAPIDWGNIVFLLVEARLLNRQESDTIEDFREAFDFDEVFVQSYRPELPADPDELGGPELG